MLTHCNSHLETKKGRPICSRSKSLTSIPRERRRTRYSKVYLNITKIFFKHVFCKFLNHKLLFLLHMGCQSHPWLNRNQRVLSDIYVFFLLSNLLTTILGSSQALLRDKWCYNLFKHHRLGLIFREKVAGIWFKFLNTFGIYMILCNYLAF